MSLDPSEVRIKLGFLEIRRKDILKLNEQFKKMTISTKEYWLGVSDCLKEYAEVEQKLIQNEHSVQLEKFLSKIRKDSTKEEIKTDGKSK